MGIIILSALIAHVAWHWMIERGERLAKFPFPKIDAAFLASAMRGLMAMLIVALAVLLCHPNDSAITIRFCPPYPQERTNGGHRGMSPFLHSARVERVALLLDVPHEPFRANLGAVNVALRIGGDALGRASGSGLLDRIGDECRHDTITDSTDPNASLPAIMILCNRFRFGIGHVNDVVLVNEDAARPAKLEPLVDVVALLVENLDTVIAAIGEKESRARIHREGMGNLHRARPGAFLPEVLKNLALFGNLEEGRMGVPAMSMGKEVAPFGTNEHRRWRVEFVRATAGDPGFAEREQHLAVRTELDDLMT